MCQFCFFYVVCFCVLVYVGGEGSSWRVLPVHLMSKSFPCGVTYPGALAPLDTCITACFILFATSRLEDFDSPYMSRLTCIM